MTAHVLNLKLREWGDKSKEAIRLKAVDVCLEAAQGIIEKTPVDTGFARAMWSVQLNDLPTMAPVARPEAHGAAESGVLGAEASAAMTVAVAGLQLGDRAYIYNPTVYAPALENGHSAQAPTGMVSVTLEELKARYA